MKRVLTQAEADQLQCLYDRRSSLSYLAPEDIRLLLDLSKEFERPTPTNHQKQREWWLSPFVKLLNNEVITKEDLKKAIEGIRE